MYFGNDWLSGEVNKITIPKNFLCGREIYSELINVQLYSPKSAVMEDPLRDLHKGNSKHFCYLGSFPNTLLPGVFIEK